MNVVIRADGGPELGFGHLIRTSTLAESFLSRSVTVTYLTKTPSTVEDVCAERVRIVELDERSSHEAVTRWLRKNDIDVVVTDSYEINGDYQRAVRSETNTLVVIQGDARYALCCDVLVNGHVFAHDIEYEWVEPEPRWCLGPDYLLIRSPFAELAERTPPWRADPKRAIIIFGGSDVQNATPVAMRAFAGFGLTVDVVIGPGYQNRDAIAQTATNVNAEFNLLTEPNDLPERMFQADFAVTGLGTTIYELMATGTPFVGFSQANNQQRTAEAIRDRELGIVVETRDTVQEGVHELIMDTQRRRTLYNNYQPLVDGNGAERLVTYLVR